jgi:hypothetical protein
VLDGAALHPVPGQTVGVLDMLGDIGSGQLARRARVGRDHHPIAQRRAHAAAGAVIDVGEAIVAPTDDAVADRHRDRAVGDVLTKRAVGAAVLARRLVERGARGVLARDQHRVAHTHRGDGLLPVRQRRGARGPITLAGVHGDAPLLPRPAQ